MGQQLNQQNGSAPSGGAGPQGAAQQPNQQQIFDILFIQQHFVVNN